MEEIIINPQTIADKLARIDLEEYGKEIMIESDFFETLVPSKELIKKVEKLVYEDDNEVKSDFFDYYTSKYDYYFELLTNEHIKIMSEKLKVKVINVSNNKLPEYKTDGSAGMDGYANLSAPLEILPNQRVLIPTGIKIELPKGYELQVRPRSGLALDYGLTILNSPGTIDSDFRGEICAIVINHNPEHTIIIKNGDRICQFVVSKYEKIEWQESESLSESERGEKGFGSTGKK